jgi:hypothetical protein
MTQPFAPASTIVCAMHLPMQYWMMAKLKPTVVCPHCGNELSMSLFAGALGAKGGRTKGPTKARTSEQASAAGKAGAKARWAKWRAEKAKK